MKTSKKIVLTGLDFLTFVQNGTLKVIVDEYQNAIGLDMADEIIENYDGMLVALYEYSEEVGKLTYNVIQKEKKEKEIESNKNNSIVD